MLRFVLIIMGVLCVSPGAFAEIALEYGQGSGKVGYINQKNRPGDDVSAMGPRSFRVVNDEFWVADTVGNKLIKLDKEGRFVSECSFAAKDEKVFVEDFAPVFAADGSLQAFWLINGFKPSLLKISPEGSKLDEIESADLLQPMKIAIDSDQNLLVTDDAAQKILIFSPAKTLIARADYEWSGLAVTDEKGAFYRLKFSQENQQTSLLKSTFAGKELAAMKITLEKHHNPHLWWVNNEKQEFFITYMTQNLAAGKVILARIGFDGSVKGSTQVKIPAIMTRFIEQKGFTEAWTGDADYRQAPDGKLLIKPQALP